ncbi:TonB-dependent receptor [Sulfurivirga sp.]|uniref:TonB-dependent receptor n=1 Tax=Sulfurivirga sp. TaxID=2614236 RepID=UPI0025D9488C|nr:TonB-dependent receptor [Sulfurivirga sp.]
MRRTLIATAVLAAVSTPALAEEMEAVSVTATKMETPASEVPHAVTVVDQQAVEQRAPRNINDVLKGIPGVTAISKSNGYDSRLIIRGAGLKARYGVREIMVIRDGVPMTDPDSFTRFDYIDIDDLDSLEVFKGPGSIEAANATGGVIYLHSKSVFDTTGDRVKAARGSFGSYDLNARKHFSAGADDMFSLNVSRRASDNDWREWNKFDTTQVSLKHGHFFNNDSALETELSYTEANLQLPGTLNQTGFDEYMDSGKTRNTPDATGSAFVKSGRYSHIFFLNSRYDTRLGDWRFQPRIYANWWDHFHPVTGTINVKYDHVVGLDLPLSRHNTLFGRKGQLVVGLTGRQDATDKSERYRYRDYLVTSGWSGTRITEVLSDEKGALMERSDSTSTLFGGYIQQHLQLTDRLSMDAGVRYDRLNFDVSGMQWERYDYAAGNYVTGAGRYSYSADYDLLSPKIGLLYKALPGVNLYANVSRGQQAPTDNEVSANYAVGRGADLKASTSTQYEVGARFRRGKLHGELAAYLINLEDEIVKRTDATGATYYTNAGRTEKKGLELSLGYTLLSWLDVGANWEGLDYRYIDFKDDGIDYSGNAVRFTPEQRWMLYADFHRGAWRARLSGRGMDAYYMDDKNTERYPGYNMVADLMVGWRHGHHDLQLNVNNLFDLRYAEEASKTWYGSYSKTSYVPGEPRYVQLRYKYTF